MEMKTVREAIRRDNTKRTEEWKWYTAKY